jgi:O-antigen/teichoic acid export membrane protein
MSSGKQIIKNSIFLTSGQILSKIINLGLILVLTRLLGKEGFGLYSFSFAFASIFIFLTHLGINHLIIREIAKHKNEANELISQTFPIVLVLSFAFLIIVNIIPLIANWSTDEQMVTLLFSFYFFFDAIARYFLGIVRAFEKMEYDALIHISERMLLMIFALFAWFLNISLLTLVMLFMLVMFAKAITAFILIRRKFVHGPLNWSLKNFVPVIKEAYPFALVILFSTVSARVDVIILKVFHSLEAVAIYNSARKIIEAISFLPENLYFAVFPALSVFYISQREKFEKTFEKTLIALIIIAIPITAGLFILAPKIVDILFEPEFGQAYLPLRWLSIALMIVFLRHATAVILNSTQRQHIFAVIFGIAMVVNITLNLILVPEYEILGASISLIVAEAVVLCGSVPFIFRDIKSSLKIVFFPKMLVAGSLISLTIYYMRNWNLILIIGLSLIAYTLIVLSLRIITISEIKEYIQIFRMKNPDPT